MTTIPRPRQPLAALHLVAVERVRGLTQRAVCDLTMLLAKWLDEHGHIDHARFLVLADETEAFAGNRAGFLRVLDCNAAELHSDPHVWDFGSGEDFVCYGVANPLIVKVVPPPVPGCVCEATDYETAGPCRVPGHDSRVDEAEAVMGA